MSPTTTMIEADAREIYVRVAPPRSLWPFVEAFSYFEGGAPSDDRYAITAKGAMSLQINLHSNVLNWYTGDGLAERHTLPGASLSGVQSRFFGIDAYQRRLVRVLFKPGGASKFFGPAGVFQNTVVAVEDIIGLDARMLRERLAEATGIREIFHVLADVFLRVLSPRNAGHPGVAIALRDAHCAPNRRISEVAASVGLSRKRLVRLFTDEVGMTPKLYFRITRFDRMLKDVASSNSRDWTDTAVANGYFDQPHLIRDFRTFAGMTPSSYLSRRTSWHDATSTPPIQWEALGMTGDHGVSKFAARWTRTT